MEWQDNDDWDNFPKFGTKAVYKEPYSQMQITHNIPEGKREVKKKVSNKSVSYIADKRSSKKPKFDSSLLKGVDFDDLINIDEKPTNGFLETAPNLDMNNFLISDLSTIKKPSLNDHIASNHHLDSNTSGNLTDDNIHFHTEDIHTQNNFHSQRKKTHHSSTTSANQEKDKKTSKCRNISAEPKVFNLRKPNVNISFKGTFKQALGKQKLPVNNNNTKHTRVKSVGDTIHQTKPINHQSTISAKATIRNSKGKGHCLSIETHDIKRPCSAIPDPDPKKIEKINLQITKKKLKDEKMRKLYEEKLEQQKKKELEKCTFKPIINTKYRVNSNHEVKKIPIYDRHALWNELKAKKLEKEKSIFKQHEAQECTFAPEVLKEHPDYHVNQKYDKTTKKYFARVNNAKKVKEEVMSKLSPNYNELYQKVSKKKPQQSSKTLEDNLPTDTVNYDAAKKELRTQLHSIVENL